MHHVIIHKTALANEAQVQNKKKKGEGDTSLPVNHSMKDKLGTSLAAVKLNYVNNKLSAVTVPVLQCTITGCNWMSVWFCADNAITESDADA